MSGRPIRFPKVSSPFVRENNENQDYVVTDQVNDGFEGNDFEWVFNDDDVVAIEKIHGTNCCVEIEQTETGLDIEAYTRYGYQPMQKVDPYGPNSEHHYITHAVQNSLQRGYLDRLGDGVHYGEVVGPKIHGNHYELDERLFIPFSWLKDKCSYNSWGKYPKTFGSIKRWFENELFSLFYSQMHGADLIESSVSNGTFCEGVVFAKKDETFQESDLDFVEVEFENDDGSVEERKFSTNLAKLRRDMFEGYRNGKWPVNRRGDH